MMSYIDLYGEFDKKKQKVLNSRPTLHLEIVIIFVVTSFLCTN